MQLISWAVALAMLPAAGATAAEEPSRTVCHVTTDLRLLPGLSVQPRSGSFYSDSRAVTCDGPVLGTRVTGPGTLLSGGRFGTADPDSCVAGGEGWGVIELRFPTSAGTKVVRSALTLTYGAMKAGSPLRGQFEGDYIDGVFDVLPVEGDCVTAALTRAAAAMTMTLHQFRAGH